MSRPNLRNAGLAAVLTLTIAACGGGGAASSAPAGSTAPSVAPPATSPAADICSETTASPTVSVSIEDFAFAPPQISAKVGDVIAFTNEDGTGHTASVIDGSCTTIVIEGGASDGLVFTVAGSYPFRCNIHRTMEGTLTIS